LGYLENKTHTHKPWLNETTAGPIQIQDNLKFNKKINNGESCTAGWNIIHIFT